MKMKAQRKKMINIKEPSDHENLIPVFKAGVGNYFRPRATLLIY